MQQVELRQESRYENYSSEMLYEEYNRLSMENIKLLDGMLAKLDGMLAKLDEKIGDK